MLCPLCHQPYFFINPERRDHSLCLSCSYVEPFTQPSYDTYHKRLYAKPYRRNPLTDPQMKKIMRIIAPQADDAILDLGCGVGDYTYALSNNTKNVIGLDLSVVSAQQKYPESTFHAHDLNTPLPFKDASFDILISINLIEHLRDEQKFLNECIRLLKKGGRIALTTANLDFILHRYFYDKTHVHEWTLRQFTSMMQPYFQTILIEKSSSMFNYYPMNHILTKILKPDLLFIGTKL
ncbi:MAG: class I SAM-dependent methyltransferase [Minisyncoccota bacterium]